MNKSIIKVGDFVTWPHGMYPNKIYEVLAIHEHNDHETLCEDEDGNRFRFSLSMLILKK